MGRLLLISSLIGVTTCGATSSRESLHSHSDHAHSDHSHSDHSHDADGARIIKGDYAFPPSDAQAALDFADEILVVTVDDVATTDFSATVLASLTSNVVPGESIMIQQPAKQPSLSGNCSVPPETERLTYSNK